MSAAAATLCLLAVLCPQGGKGGIVLPPLPARTEPRAADPGGGQEPQLSESERFRREVFKLRQSASLSREATDLVLGEIGVGFAQPAPLALALARTANADLMHGVLEVQRRYGSAQDVDELLYLLLTRPFGTATRSGVETAADLAGADAKKTLMSCFVARYAGVRKAATDLLLARIEAADLPQVLELSRSDAADVRRKALFLLGALPHPDARARLIEALVERDTTIAATACRALVDHGREVALDLQAIVARPARGRDFGYAAYALTELEDRTGEAFLDAGMVPHLRAEMTGSDSFLRATCAIAMANLAFRSDDRHGAAFGDRDIIDGLLLVVAPRTFVSNISMLQQAATRKLVEFSGVDLRGRNAAWHAWWDKARTDFVGARLAVEVTPETGALATLTFSEPRRSYRFHGESVGWFADETRDDVDDFILSGAEMAALVQRLRAQGFMTRALLATAAAETLPSARAVDLRLGSSRCRLAGPAVTARWMDTLASEIEAVVERERWQMYRPAGETDVRAYWQREREWLAAHPEPLDRDQRMVRRILASYEGLSSPRRGRAIAHLMLLPELPQLLTAADGVALIAMIERAQELDEEAFQLAELALMTPGEGVWRRLLTAVESHWASGGEQALRRLFALLGPERVRQTIASASPRLARVAMLEAANLRDAGAAEVLMRALQSEDTEVRETAVYALGVIGVAAARWPLLELESSPDTAPGTRRVVWVALGRIGGEGVFQILQSAVASPSLAEQLAAIQALGELGEQRSAHLLAQLLVAHGRNPRGTQAAASLQKLGPLLARPALRRHLDVRDDRVRREVVELLAEFQDPSVVPDLITAMELEPERSRPAQLLASITGVDVPQLNNRVAAMREWWRKNKDRPQALWFMDCLAANKIATSLAVDALAPDSGHAAVPELTRILVEARVPHVRVLAAAMLRETTARDYGVISTSTDPGRLQAIADRYRFFADAERSATGR